MNTRLQVEHSVTEFITGIDIVEWMIRVAAGEPLGFRQDHIQLKGWAIESRIYAEDPNRGFLPSTGRIVRYTSAKEDRDVRVDNGVYEGGEVSMFYDPMIAKVTTWGRDRDSAVALMRRSLDEFHINGVAHNLAFLTALMANPRFLAGDMTTNFIAEEYPDGFVPAPLDEGQIDNIVAVAALMHLRYTYRATKTAGVMRGFERTIPNAWAVVVEGTHYPVEVTPFADRPGEGFNIALDDRKLTIRSDWKPGDPVLRCMIRRAQHRFGVERRGLGYRLFHLGSETDVVVYRRRVAELAKIVPQRKPRDMSKYVLSPMPGMLKSLAVATGDRVGPDSEIAVVEAMKMENVLKSVRYGSIAKLHAKPGDTLAVGQIIAEFE